MFLGRKRIDTRAVNAKGIELALDTLEDGLPAGEEAGQLCHDGIDLLGGGHIALVVDGLFFEFCQVGQAAHAHHKEFVEIGLEDRDELKALEQRHGFIEGLVEHAVVKAQPAELSILRVREVARRLAQLSGLLLLFDFARHMHLSVQSLQGTVA